MEKRGIPLCLTRLVGGGFFPFFRLSLGPLFALILTVLTASATDYTLITSVVDNGGGSTESTDYRIVGSVTADPSSPAIITSADYTVYNGFIGQLSNVLPTAVPDVAVLDSSGSVSVDVLQNDSDSDGDILTLTSVSGIVGGTASISAGRYVNYLATAAFSGIGSLTYTVRDAEGNASSSTLTISDTTAPVLTVPGNVTASATSSSGGVVSYPVATASDSVTASPTVTYSKASGTVFPMGTTTVTVTATDAANNVSTGTFTVTVTDTAGPVLTLPGNVTANATSSSGATVSYPAATASDNVTASPTVTYSKASGTVFPMGTTTVTVTATDAANNVSTGTFTVTVSRYSPIITWPIPASIGYGTALGGAELNASADVPGAFVYNPPLGTILHAGSGQTLSMTFTPFDTGSHEAITQTRSINVAKAALTFRANDKVRAYGQADPAFDGVYTGFVNGDTSASLSNSVSFSSGATSASTAGAYTITPSGAPSSANYAITYLAGTLTITNKLVPTVTWATPTSIVYGTALSSAQLNAGANVSGTFAYTPSFGTVLGAGSEQTLSVTFTPTDTANYAPVTETRLIEVSKAVPILTWSNPAPVVYGTRLSATQLNASAIEAGTFVYTPEIGTVLNAGASQLLSVTFVPADSANRLIVGGSVLLSVEKAELIVRANSKSRDENQSDPLFDGAYSGLVNGDVATAIGLSVTYATTAGSSAAVGTYPITLRGPSTISNYRVTYQPGTLTVRDATAPVLNVPANVMASATSASGAVVFYPAATATDNVTASPVITYSKASGTVFGVGNTTVTVTATDVANNVSTGTFTVTVNDATPPVLDLPANITMGATNANGATVSYPAATATDNVTANPVVTYSKASGTVFAIGTTVVTATATDGANNVSTGTFTVTVSDTLAPVLSLPGPVTATTAGGGEVAVTYPAATATDNVTANPRITYSKASGTVFPLGITPVLVTAIDGAGNVSTGTFTVTVSAPQTLVFTGVPTNQTVEAVSASGAVVNFEMPTAATAAGNVPVVVNKTSGSVFPLGQTTVTFSANGQGQSASAHFVVTVVDTTAPKLALPERVTAKATSADGALVTYPAASGVDLVTGTPFVAYSRSSGSMFPMGTTTVEVVAIDDAKNVSKGSFEVVVEKEPQTIRFDSMPDRLLRERAIRLDASSSSGMPVEYRVTGPATLMAGSLLLTGTGAVTVSASQSGNSIYLPAEEVVRSFSVFKTAMRQSIAFDVSKTKATYGDLPIVLSGAASSRLPLRFAVAKGSPARLGADGITLEITGAGVVTVTASQSGSSAYRTAPPVTSRITVRKKKLRVIAAGSTRFVGTPNPTLSLSYEGLVNGETEAVLDKKPLLATTAKQTSPAGVYPISVSRGADGNYDFEYQGADLVVRPLATSPQTITFDLSKTAATYGDAPIRLNGTASSGLPVTFAVVKGSPARLGRDGLTVELTGAGVVKIEASQAGNSVFSAAPPVTRDLNVAKKKLRVVAAELTRVVGKANPRLAFVYEGFVNNETETVLDKKPTVSTPAKPSSAAGEYPITVNGGADANYALEYQDAKLKVMGFGGTYEGLLFAASDAKLRVPVGKVEVTVLSNAMSYSGVLKLASEAASVKLSGGVLTLADGGSMATGTLTLRNRKNGAAALPNLVVRVAVAANSFEAFVDAGSVALTAGRTAVRTAESGPFPQAGAYTLLIAPPKKILESDQRAIPSGYGYATAKVDANSGLLTLAGKLADGTSLSGSYRPDASGSYRIFTSPYVGRTGSTVAGVFALRPTTLGYAILEDEGTLVWSKTGRSNDPASYTLGFGPSECGISLSPWRPPTVAVPSENIPAVSLGTLLGLEASASGSKFEVSHSGASLGALTPSLPSVALLGGDNRTVILNNPNPTRWTMQVDPLTGTFTGSFELSDLVPPGTNPAVRKVNFSGALRQGADALMGGGFFTVPPLPGGEGAGATSGAIELSVPK
jgi:hypothetical protein